MLKPDQSPSSIRPETTPLYTASVYTFPNLDSVQAYYQQPDGAGQYLYRRNGHPNEGPVERRIADMEHAESATLCASGMAAISQTLFALLKPGDHMLATAQFYGGAYALFEQILKPWGVEVSYCNLNDLSAVNEAIQPNTALIYAESISNPLVEVADLRHIADVSQARGIHLVVDNTFATPHLCRPLNHGATLSIHSLTKYLNGHSDVIGGAVAGSHDLITRIRRFAVTFGGTLDPFDAWMTERGLETFHLRFPRQCENAVDVAQFLADHPVVTKVYYPGLSSHPTHELASQVLSGGFGAMLSFEVDGGYDAANAVVAALKSIPFAPSLGGVKTTISHPELTSHRAFSGAQRLLMGVSGGLLRLSLGIEPVEQIKQDLAQALAAASAC